MSRRFFSAPSEILNPQGTLDLLGRVNARLARLHSLPFGIAQASIFSLLRCFDPGEVAPRH
jgi:hypothetical protein